jgi:hypothetical protein
MEYWSDGVMLSEPTTPLLHHSNTPAIFYGVMEYWSSGVIYPDPTLHYSITPILQK